LLSGPHLRQRQGDRVISVDNYFDRHPINEEDIQILSMLARQAGLAIENARLYEYN